MQSKKSRKEWPKKELRVIFVPGTVAYTCNLGSLGGRDLAD
jgi:hypothetical protein